MRNTFIETLVECAEQDDRIVLLTADLGYSVVEKFAERFPNRFYNVGIAEQNGVSMAAGLSLAGKVVYFYSIIPFATMRCFEQIRVDVAYLNTNVRLVGVGAGLGYGPAGATHHAYEDIAIMRALPGMAVICPGDPIETRALTRTSVNHQGPMYLRLGKGGEAKVHSKEMSLAVGEMIELSHGTDFTLFTTSNMLETGSQVVNELAGLGISGRLISVPTVKPLNVGKVDELVRTGAPIFTLEEHSLIGGLGSALAEVLAETGKSIGFKRFALRDEYTHLVGSQGYLRKHFKLDVKSVADSIRLKINKV